MRRLFGRIRSGMPALGHQHRHDAGLEDEPCAFRDAGIDAKIAAGMPRVAAERAARAALGSAAAIREYVGDVGWKTWVDGVWLDLRQAARRLRATPGFVAAIGPDPRSGRRDQHRGLLSGRRRATQIDPVVALRAE